MTYALYNALEHSRIKPRVLRSTNAYQFCYAMHMLKLLMHQQNSALIVLGMD